MRTSINRTNNTFLIATNDQKEIGRALKAIQTLGFHVKAIRIKSCSFVFFDSKYYNRFSEALLRRANQILSIGQQPVIYKNNRFYIEVDGQELILPIDMYSSFDTKELWIEVEIS